MNRVKYFAIEADETKDNAKTEQLSTYVRYWDSEAKMVKERFLSFTDIHKLDADTVFNHILGDVNSAGMDINSCVAQAYDGASTMIGECVKECALCVYCCILSVVVGRCYMRLCFLTVVGIDDNCFSQFFRFLLS